MAETLLGPATLAAIGGERPLRKGLITERDIRKFCVALDEIDPLYLDCQAARAAGYENIIAPPLFPIAATRPVPERSRLLQDGQYDDLAPPGLEHLQSLVAGQDWEFFRPAVCGETVTERVGIRSIEERQGRSGKMVFVAEESVVSDSRGDPIMRSVTNLVFREPLPPKVLDQPVQNMPTPAPVPGDDVHTLVKQPDMVTLFMFMAAIWGVHRIHYDIPYAQGEGLPSAILPAWMLAAYLCQLAARQPGGRDGLKRLSVRCHASAFPGDILTCRSVDKDAQGEIKMLITSQTGAEIMTGVATINGR